MQELVGRLIALDQEASETLKVVTYFDALVTAGVGLDGLLRGAAALSGAVAGAERSGKITRWDSSGARLDASATSVRSPQRVTPTASVWLERAGRLHANDAMVVERLGLAVDILDSRRVPENSLDIVLDAGRALEERSTALARLHLDPSTRIRIIGTSMARQAPGAASTVVPTRYGMLRASIDRKGAVPDGRAGLGIWVRADHAPESWESAVIAHRLTGPDHPRVDATDLGLMLRLAQSFDPEEPHDDILALRRLDDRAAAVLLTLVQADSIRSAATELGMHHSTVQARHEALTRELKYDPRTPVGRMRYVAAGLLLRLMDPPPFDE
ncbi:hypothetical protein [Dietzia lutea]|uniref:PucR C-terminal helix-turn-helix domain-containing protein n=1 Tax=Dietzia lutea TaxID=546160 RepID=A0A2S1R3X2_9ACTN|nr:hypothetical protein [Dietzia lutea]AWH90977.1 hypothetical protein A6035_00915 [Dietzia lutea]